MNKKRLFGIILILTYLAIIIILVLNTSIKYNTLILSESEWNKIISNRNMSTSISIESIEFNDYNSIIYYSVVNSNHKYNPSIKYKTNKKVNIKINGSITDEKIEQSDSLKIIIYNNKEYRIYSLVATNYPIINIIYKENKNDTKKIPIELEIFDNHTHSTRRVIKSDGIFNIIEENKTYGFSLIKKSLGNNKRENHISIFSEEKQDEYILKQVEYTIDSSERHENNIKLFINNKYIGLYSLRPKERRINNFERNKENNR